MARGEGEATGSGFQARCGAVALITIGAGLDDDAYEAMGRLIAGEPPVGMSGPFDRLREGDVAGAGAIEEDELEGLEENGESEPALSIAPKGEETLSVIHALAAEPMAVAELERAIGRLGVRIPGEEPLLAGATVEVGRGAVIASSPLLESEPENWVTGTPLEWCDTVMDPSEPKLGVGGDSALARLLSGWAATPRSRAS